MNDVTCRGYAPALMAALLFTPAATSTLSAQAAPAPLDSGSLFTKRDAVLTGLAVAATAAVFSVDSRIAHRFQAGNPNYAAGTTLRSAAEKFSFVNEKSLSGAGVLGYAISRVATGPTSASTDIAAHVSEAVLISTVFNTVIRGVGGRSRPFVTNGDNPHDFNLGKGFSNFDYRAFPSVHASSSFATAAVLTAETRRRHPGAALAVGLVSYGVAAMPGLSRIYLGKHWASDVVMGAFVGTLTGLKVEWFEHSRQDSWVRRVFLH